jgi:prepilin signal peptidase PulO-like enzyme (type II secretory pathway)
MVSITFVDAETSYRALLPAALLFGLGLGVVHGAASAGPALPQALGATLLLATGGALFQHVVLESRGAGAGFEQAFADALAATAWLEAAVLLLAAVVAFRTVPSSARAVS